MQDFAIVVFFFVATGLVVAGALYAAHLARSRFETYRRAATRFDGRAYDGGLFGWPHLTFRRDGISVRVDTCMSGGDDSTHYTQVHLTWPDRKTRCEVYPERFGSRLGKLMGMQDVEIGSPEFDRNYIITGSSPQSLRELLTPAVQRRIDGLRGMFATDDVYLSISAGKMLVKKRCRLDDAAPLISYIEAALELFDEARGVGDAGVEFVGETSATGSEEVVCQICGEPIVSERVVCRRCKTPHHDDCWEYFGGCSTFGCGERKCLPG